MDTTIRIFIIEDRAKERRKGNLQDDDNTNNNNNNDVDYSKVKGLDFGLLQKARENLEQSNNNGDISNNKINTQQHRNEKKKIQFKSTLSENIYKLAVLNQPTSKSTKNDLFRAGRMIYVFDLDHDFAQNIPTTIINNAEDYVCEPKQPIEKPPSLSSKKNKIGYFDNKDQDMEFVNNNNNNEKEKEEEDGEIQDINLDLEEAEDDQQGPAMPGPGVDYEDYSYEDYPDTDQNYEQQQQSMNEEEQDDTKQQFDDNSSSSSSDNEEDNILTTTTTNESLKRKLLEQDSYGECYPGIYEFKGFERERGEKTEEYSKNYKPTPKGCNKIPGPLALPVIGNFLAFGKNPHLDLFDLSKRFGHFYRLHFGDVQTLIVSDPNIIREIWIKNNEIFLNRYHTPSLRIYTGNFRSLGGGDEFYWRKNRAIVGHSFTKTKIIQLGTNIIESQVKELVQVLKEYSKTGQSFYPRGYFKKLSLNIVMKYFFNEEIPYDEKFSSIVVSFEKMVEEVGQANVCDYISVLSPLYYFYKQYITGSALDSIKVIMNGIIREHIKLLDPENPRDFLDTIIVSCKEKGMEEDIPLLIGLDFMMAGADTTSGASEWFLIYMANNQDIQEIAYQELNNQLGNDRDFITMKDRPNSPYLCAIIKEVLRIRPTLPLGLSRTAHQDTIINDYFIPKGTQIIQNIYTLHHSNDYWDEPDKFSPERFLSNKTQDENIFIPFGVGNRNCLGSHFANEELYVLFANILLNYKILPPNDLKNIDDSPKFGISKTDTIYRDIESLSEYGYLEDVQIMNIEPIENLLVKLSYLIEDDSIFPVIKRLKVLEELDITIYGNLERLTIPPGVIPDSVKRFTLLLDNLTTQFHPEGTLVKGSIPLSVESMWIEHQFFKENPQELIPSSVIDLEIDNWSFEIGDSCVDLIPRSVIYLTFSTGYEGQQLWNYKFPLVPNSIPKTVETLSFEEYNHSINQDTFLQNIKLKVLDLGTTFKETISIKSIPPNVVQFSATNRFFKELEINNIFPDTLKKLEIGEMVSTKTSIKLPQSLEFLDCYFKNIIVGLLPPKLKSLTLRSNIESIEMDAIVPSIKSIFFEKTLRIPIEKGIIPTSVKELGFYEISVNIPFPVIPESVSTLHLNIVHTNAMTIGDIPDSTYAEFEGFINLNKFSK
eukprot:gene2260-2783_t